MLRNLSIKINCSKDSNATAVFTNIFTEISCCKNPPKILSKIDFNVSSYASGTFKIIKWRIKRGVSSERPPLGGAAAQTTENFSIFFQKKLGLSYMPP